MVKLDFFSKAQEGCAVENTQVLKESVRMVTTALTTFVFNGAHRFHFSRLTGTFKVG